MRNVAIPAAPWRPNGAAVAEREPERGDNEAARQILARAEAISLACAEEATALDAEGRFPVEAFARIRAAGLLAAPLPRALGGHGLGPKRRISSDSAWQHFERWPTGGERRAKY